ncbi:MAG: efflux RND transporter permease subunit [bacterium]|jgi:multidrug efflux pump subunit AcrB
MKEASKIAQTDEGNSDGLNVGGWLTHVFIDSKITMLLIVTAMIFGVLALLVTPREENPQISVPSAHVMIMFPGASAEEVEKLIAEPVERLIWKINGIEHVYSSSMPGMAVVTARFYVGQNQEESIFKVYNQVYSNLDGIPQGVMPPLVKPVDINDVPVVAITLYSNSLSDYELRREANRILDTLREVPGTSDAIVVGGQKRQVTVEIDPVKLSAYGLDLPYIVQAIEAANQELPAGDIEKDGLKHLVQTGRFFENADDVASLVVGGQAGRPIYLRDVAKIMDGPGERTTITRIAFGPAASGHDAHFEGEGKKSGTSYPAVTLAVAKKKGQNAVVISNNIIEKMKVLAAQGGLAPGVDWVVTRNDGKRANDAVNELVSHLGWAIVIVLALAVVSLGWRDAAVMSVALVLTLLVTLGIGLLAGQTINRITLFALILSLGLLVDDPIVVVENIHRHLSMKYCARRDACVKAVNEISAPTIYATLAVIVSMIPMAFVTGMMGPYMGPIPFNVPVAMLASLIVAFQITPYLAKRWIKVGHTHGAKPIEQTFAFKFYKKTMTPLLESTASRRLLFAGLAVALLLSFTLPVFQLVKFRMLPKANTNTFLVTIDMPDGTVLARTNDAARKVEKFLLEQPEVKDVETFVGTGSIVDFNGLLRGTSFRNATHYADLRVNLVHKHHRKASSEDIVARLRPVIDEMEMELGANIKLVEDPPGPPVRSTLVAELYGPYGDEQKQIAGEIAARFAQTQGVVDIDSTVKSVQPQFTITVDRAKAHSIGVPVQLVVQTISGLMNGYAVSALHDSSEEEQVPIVLRYPLEKRTSLADLSGVTVTSMAGVKVPVTELVRFENSEVDQTIHHKNLKPITYVFGEMANRSSVYAMIDLLKWQAGLKLPPGFKLEWEGEWDLTLKVFRDLGIAMGVAILLIYLIMVGRFHSFTEPLVILGAVPLTMLGVLPGFALIGGFGIYFSATGMIGVIALSGIVVRNSIILIEFIADQKAAGKSLEQAVIEAGAVRTRPIVLTAVAAMSGMFVIVSDPVWSGLAWAIIFGVIASTTLSLGVIPLLYYSLKAKEWKKARPA